jgi:creatinine amidohydrolase
LEKLVALRIEELSAPKFTEILKKTKTVVVPLGSIEQHGPHLPLGTDLIIATEIARRIADGLGCPLGPAIPYGNSIVMRNMTGTFTLSPNTFSANMADICRTYASQGFKTVILVNGHAGNIGSLDQVAFEVSQEKGIRVIRIDWWIIAQREIRQILESPLYHACEGETSVMLAINPNLVDMRRASKDETMADLANRLTEKRPEEMPELYTAFEKLTKTGVVGDPVKANTSKGQRILDIVVENSLQFLKRLEKETS